MKRTYTVCLILFFLSGCNEPTHSLQNNIKNVSDGNNTSSVGTKNDFYVIEDKNTIREFEVKNKSLEDREEVIQKVLNTLPELEDANIKIIGNMAVVNISMKGALTDQSLNQMKKTIRKKVKELDQSIDHVSVNASNDLFDTATRQLPLPDGEKPPHNEIVDDLLKNATPSM